MKVYRKVLNFFKNHSLILDYGRKKIGSNFRETNETNLWNFFST